jgi:hypothetical protein
MHAATFKRLTAAAAAIEEDEVYFPLMKTHTLIHT